MGISFSGEASETFATFVSFMGERRYTVEVRTLEGEEFTATVCGVDPNSEWCDAVLLSRWDDEHEGTGPFVSYRVSELHVI